MIAVPLPAIPDLVALHATRPAHYPYLLHTGGGYAGWDILFAHPRVTHVFAAHESGVLDALRATWYAEGGVANPPNHLPFTGGWFVYLGYEVLEEIEPRVSPRSGCSAFPKAVLSRVPAALLVDQANVQAWLVAETQEAREAIEADLAAPVAWQPRALAAQWVAEEEPEIFLKGVGRILRYIREGDVFQVNLARRWWAALNGNTGPADLFAALARHNPAPFAGSAVFGSQAIVSSSPERLVRVRDGLVETRPIAGTRPRAADPQADLALRRELLATVKERAEHIMLVDLERNDLGRVCVPGSVEVPALLELTSYAHVHHLESTVRGRLRPGVDPVAVVRALFPGGTITGCPKVRCMQIIRELENAPRQAYTGSMGYLNRDGSLDLNILIRSFMVRGAELEFWAGAGIVADSIPERELAETRAKARGLLRALSPPKAP
ncbi:aminodeoxychorismate synthase component I [Thiobacter aerophilum]|uniref:Aminodeoxychorismate synthase component I n=1 Tax=Thiobacter aerophilum TaxID=3121275 RepID=A0ABV0EAF9_9BURK